MKDGSIVEKDMTKKAELYILFVFTFFAALLLWQFLRETRTTKDVNSQTVNSKTSVIVAQVGEFFIYLPLYYTVDRGFFDRQGLDVRLVNSGGDEKSVAAVISRSADFGVGDPTFAAIAKTNGQDVRVVASVVNGVPFWGVTEKPDIPPITSPNQLKGLTVATFPKPSTAYVLQEIMYRDGGLQPSIREAQFGSLLPLLKTGTVDIALELEPNVSTVVASGGRILYSMAERYPKFAITGVTVLGQTLTERPDLVKRFVAALNEAEKAAHAEPNDVVAFAKSRFRNVPPEIAEAAARRMLDSGVFPSRAAVSTEGWRQALQIRVQSGDLKSVAVGDGLIANQVDP